MEELEHEMCEQREQGWERRRRSKGSGREGLVLNGPPELARLHRPSMGNHLVQFKSPKFLSALAQRYHVWETSLFAGASYINCTIGRRFGPSWYQVRIAGGQVKEKNWRWCCGSRQCIRIKIGQL